MKIIKKILLSTGIIAILFISNHFLEIKAQVVNCPTNTTNVNGSCISNNNFLYSSSTNYIRPIVSSSTINPSNIKISTTTGNVLQNLNGLFSPATGGGSATNTLNGNNANNTLTLSDTNGNSTSTVVQVGEVYRKSTSTISIPLAYSLTAGTFGITSRTFDIVGGINGSKNTYTQSITATQNSNVFTITGTIPANVTAGNYIEINNTAPIYKIVSITGNNVTVNRNYTATTQTFSNYEVFTGTITTGAISGITSTATYQTAMITALVNTWTSLNSNYNLSFTTPTGFNTTLNGSYNANNSVPVNPLGEIYVVDVTAGLTIADANFLLYNQNQGTPSVWSPAYSVNGVVKDIIDVEIGNQIIAGTNVSISKDRVSKAVTINTIIPPISATNTINDSEITLYSANPIKPISPASGTDFIISNGTISILNNPSYSTTTIAQKLVTDIGSGVLLGGDQNVISPANIINIKRSVDGGSNWTLSTTTTGAITVFYTQNINGVYTIFAFSDFGNFFYKSIDLGLTWTLISTNTIIGPNNVVGYNNTSILISGQTDGIYKSIDAGVTWVQKSSLSITDIYMGDNIIYATTQSNGVLYSLDGGETWIQSNLSTGITRNITQIDNNTYIVTTNSGVYRTTNKINWTNVNGFGSLSDITYNQGTLYSFDIVGKNIYQSMDLGMSWTLLSPFPLTGNPSYTWKSNGTNWYSYSTAGANSLIFTFPKYQSPNSWKNTTNGALWKSTIRFTATTTGTTTNYNTIISDVFTYNPTNISGEGTPNYLAIWNGTTSLSTSTIDYFSSTTEIAKLTLNGGKLGYSESFFNKGFYFTSNNYNENVGQLNTVFGNNALSSQTNAIATAAFGQSCLYSFDSGYGNTCYGIGGLNSLLIGGGNTALGENSLPALQGGNRNIGIGQNTNVLLLNADDQLNIGNWIYGNQGNISIGSSTAPYSTPAAQFYVDGITRLNNPLFLTQTNFKATSSILGNTGITPRQLTIDTAGNIYTANYASNSVSKITPAGATSILGTTGVNPFGIAVDSNGNVYTANSGVGNITKITPAGTSSIFATGLYYPWGMTIDSNNNLYVTSYFGNNVYKITSTGTITTLGTTGANPYNIIVGNDNFIYTTNYGSSSVSKINPTTGTSSILGNTGSLPYGLVMDASGNIYTANDGSGTISKITPAGLSSVFAVTGGKPRGIVLDGKGKLYVTETQNDLIIMIDTTTGQTSTLISAIDNVIDPFGLVIDSSGVLYSANAGSNNVSKIFQPYLNKSLTIDNTGNVILGATSNGVNSVNNIQGDVNLNAGTGIGINNSGKNITITNTGSGTAGSGNAIDFTLNQWGEEALNVPSSERAYIKMGFTNSTEIGTGGSLAGVTYWDTSRNAPTGAGIGIRQQVATQFTNISLVVYTPAYTVNFTTPAGAVASNFALDRLLLSKRSASSTSEPFLNSNLFPTFRDSPGASDDVQMIPVVKPTITITGTAPNFTATISSGVWRSSFQNYNWNLSDTNVEYVPYLGIYETSGVTFPPTITSITRNSGLGGIQVLSSIPGTGGATPSLSQVVTVGNTLNSGQSISFPSVSSIQIADGTAGQFLVKGAGNSVTWGSGGSGSAPLKWGDISLNSFIASTTVSIATTTLSFSTPTTSIGTVDLRQLQVNGVLNSYYRFIPQIGNTFETSSFDSYWTTWNSVTKTLSGLVARRGIITN